MRRVRRFNVLALAVLPVLASSHVIGQVTSAPWQTSWEAFVVAIAPYVAKSENSARPEVLQKFVDKQVVWEASVPSGRSLTDRTSFNVKVTARKLRVSSVQAEGGGGELTVDTVLVFPKAGTLDVWRNASPDKPFRFRGVLKDPVYVVFAAGGKVFLTFSVKDAEIVSGPDLR